MAELVYALALGASGAIREGSSPSLPTICTEYGNPEVSGDRNLMKRSSMKDGLEIDVDEATLGLLLGRAS